MWLLGSATFYLIFYMWLLGDWIFYLWIMHMFYLWNVVTVVLLHVDWFLYGVYFSFADLLLVFLTCDFLTCGCSTFGFFDLWIVRPFFHAKIFTCRFDWFFTCGSFYLLVFYLWIVSYFYQWIFYLCIFFLWIFTWVCNWTPVGYLQGSQFKT